jgi:hypothetical protein
LHRLPADEDNAAMASPNEIERLMQQLQELRDRLDGLADQRTDSQVQFTDAQEEQIAELHSRIVQGLVDLLEITKREISRIKGRAGQ